MEGVNGLMIAADTVGKGHVTEYSSDRETHALQIPFKDGVLPEHHIVGSGVCRDNVEPYAKSGLSISEQSPDLGPFDTDNTT